MEESLDEKFSILSKEGYMSEEELKKEAYRALLRERPELRITLAVEEYKKEEITLNRAAELAGVNTEKMKEVLKRRGVEIKRGFISEEERSDRAEELAEGA